MCEHLQLCEEKDSSHFAKLLLPGWAWTPDMLRTLKEYTPKLSSKYIRVCKDTLTVSQLTGDLLAVAIDVVPQALA